MFRLLWFRKLVGLRSRIVRRHQAAQHRRHVRLQLEGLEERVTPDSLPFPTAHNGSELQQNITFINGHTSQAWSFNLQANTTFNLTAQQELTAGANATIIGQGGDVITPAAGIRAFKVDASATAKFDNLTISGGRITATDATTNPGGAALWVAGGSATLNGVSVTNNTVFASDATGAPDPLGGGILVVGAASNLTIANSLIDINQVLGANTLLQVPSVTPEGGGIFVNGGVINISASTLSNNRALGGNAVTPNGGNAAGGGIAAGAGVINISASTLSNNKALGGSSDKAIGGSADGGGMSVGGTTSVLLTNLTVEGNVAQGGSGLNGGTGQGGAFSFEGPGPIKLVGSLVTNNTASGGNGSTGDGGVAGGGGLYNIAGTTTATTILNSSFLLNTALGGNGSFGGIALGGAIEQDGFGKLNLLNSTLGQNKAQGGNGQGSGFGGGLAVNNQFPLPDLLPQLFNNTIVFNQALNGTGTAAGGGIWTLTAGFDVAIALNNLVQGNTTNGVGPDVNDGGVSFALPLPFNITGGPVLQIAPTLTVVNGLPIYPLLPNATLAINLGIPSIVAAIAAAEGVNATNATDEVGSPRTTGNGTQIDIGAVQLLTVNAPPSPLPPPSPPPPPTMSQAVLALILDAFELVLSLDGFGPMLHLPSPNALEGSIGANLPFAGSLGIPALIAGVNAANDALSNTGP
jgi:hypothetical protein